MGDMAEDMRALKEHGKEVRKRITEENQRFREQMIVLGAREIELTTNSYRYSFADFSIDYYPPSGKWSVVRTNKYNVGPRKMVEEAKRRLQVTTTPAAPVLDETPPPAIQRVLNDDDTPPWEI